MYWPIKQSVPIRNLTIKTRAVSAFRFYGCSMFICKPIFPDVYIWRTLGFLGPWLYGFATVSYNQIWDHMKFWQAHPAISTAVLQVKNILAKPRWTDFCLKQLWVVGIINMGLNWAHSINLKPITILKILIKSIFFEGGGTKLQYPIKIKIICNQNEIIIK